MNSVNQTMDFGRAAAGDPDAFRGLVTSTKGVVTSIALAIVRDVRASEDVAQEVYLKVWRELPQLRREESFLPWLRQLTRNEALTHVRARGRYAKRFASSVLAPASAEPEARIVSALDAAVSREEERVLEEALAALPDDTRDVLILFYREGQSVAQVARLLDIGEAAVKKRLERARRALRTGVEARFAEAAERTAVGAAFVAMVAGSLALATPSAAAAATQIPQLTKIAKLAPAATTGVTAVSLTKLARLGLLAKILAPVLAAVGVTALVGVAAVALVTRRLLRGALDDRERAELRAFAATGAALVIGFDVALVASLLALPWIGDTGASIGVLLSWLGFGILGGHQVAYRLPRILARRRARDREADPDAFARAERRRSRRAIVILALTCAGLAGAWCLIVFRV